MFIMKKSETEKICNTVKSTKHSKFNASIFIYKALYFIKLSLFSYINYIYIYPW